MEASKVTAGEIISHLVKISSFEDISRHLTTLLGTSYFAAAGPMPLHRMTTFEIEHPQAWETLAGVFHDRHVACHELDPRAPWTFSGTRRQWRVGLHLIEANERLLRVKRVKPGKWPTTPGRLLFLFSGNR